jgi:chitodextrinase
VTVEWSAPSEGSPVKNYEVRGGEEVVRAAGTSARVARLAPSRRYCFAVWALGAGDLRSEGSAPVCVETPPDTTPPATPVGLAAVARAGEVRLRWSAASDDVGVVGYEVLRGETVIASASALQALETGLPPARHCFTVRALDAAGNRSAPSAPACATTPDVTPPSAPAAVTAAAPVEGEVAVGWAPSSDDVAVAGYEVRREGTPLARVNGLGAQERGLRAATRYCYQVIAYDAAGNRSAPSDSACAVTPDLTPPAPPARLEASAAGEGSVILSWAEAADNVAVTGYEVWRGGSALTRLGPATRFDDEGPKSSTETCYTVRALDAAGNQSQPSPSACAPTPDITAPSTPAGVAAAASSPRRIVLSWNASTDNVGVGGYDVLRDGAVIARVRGTSAAEEPLEALREYCYTVRAHDAAGNRSPPSARACARTPDPSLPLPPSNLLAARIAADEIELRWDASPTPGVTYVVSWDGTRRAPAREAGKGRELGTTPLTRLGVFGQPARERHCYRVLARHGAEESPETLPVCTEGAAVTAR